MWNAVKLHNTIHLLSDRALCLIPAERAAMPSHSTSSFELRDILSKQYVFNVGGGHLLCRHWRWKDYMSLGMGYFGTIFPLLLPYAIPL